LGIQIFLKDEAEIEDSILICTYPLWTVWVRDSFRKKVKGHNKKKALWPFSFTNSY